jgi:hypothetical protein
VVALAILVVWAVFAWLTASKDFRGARVDGAGPRPRVPECGGGWERAVAHSSPETERRSSPCLRQGLGRGSLMTQQDRWWLAISIVWLFLAPGAALPRLRMKGRLSWDRPLPSLVRRLVRFGRRASGGRSLRRGVGMASARQPDTALEICSTRCRGYRSDGLLVGLPDIGVLHD